MKREGRGRSFARSLSPVQRGLLRKAIVGLSGVLLCVFFLRVIFGIGGAETLPDFSTYSSLDERKAAFFAYLRPRAEKALAAVEKSRNRLIAIEADWDRRGKLKSSAEKRLRKLAASYGMELDPETAVSRSDLAEIKARVDVVPVSLVLAQASLESAWGTSRFAREGNNLFGMRCYKRGCGIVPARRAAGATFEVTRFDSLADCFTAYVKNLNTHAAYAELRRIRANLRREHQEITGYRLAPGLLRYSEEGWKYVGKIQALISANRLDGTL